MTNIKSQINFIPIAIGIKHQINFKYQISSRFQISNLCAYEKANFYFILIHFDF